MHPFRCVPPRAQWVIKQDRISDNVYENTKLDWSVSTDEQITQRVNADFVASTSIPHTPFPVQTNSRPKNQRPNLSNIEELWPATPDPTVKLDIDPSPPSLVAKYEETVFGSSPLFYFLKQVLNKARSCMENDFYVAALKELMLSPDELDKRYHSQYGDPKYLERAELKVAEQGISFAESLGQLRARDTQIQTILAMELYCVAPPSASSKAQQDAYLQLYFDRLCIWQAVGTHPNSATEFCTSILIPYYKTRSPKKTRQLVKVSKGTVRTGHIKQKPKVAPRLIKAPGLLRALELQNAGNNNGSSSSRNTPSSPAESPLTSSSFSNSVSPPAASNSPSVLQATRTHSRPSAARSISHPVYRQQSLGGTVEIRFRPMRRGERRTSSSSSGAAVPSPAPASAEISKSTSALGPAPLVPAPPASPPRARQSIIPNSIQATPEKERQRYLSIALEDEDEEIGSTDSD